RAGCACDEAVTQTSASAARMDFFMIAFRTNCGNRSVSARSPSAVFRRAKALCGLSEWVDVVQYRDLPQDDLAHHARRFDAQGVDRSIARDSDVEARSSRAG